MSTIKLRRSAVPDNVPSTSQLELGEVAINTHDGKMFFKRDKDGTLSIREVGLSDKVDNVLYVSESGDDTNNGETLAESFRTLNAALLVATAGTTIFLKSGTHTLDNDAGGVDVPAGVSIVGDNHRSTTLIGSTSTNDMLYVRNNCYVTGIGFKGHTNGAAAIAFNPNGSAGEIINSPYIQNCSSITTTGTGMRVDGAHCSGLRSMVSDAYTQINAGGIGIHIKNRGYAQLVSIFTVSCDYGFLCESGGQCSISNSNSSFGNYGLKATGSSSVLYSGTVGVAASRNDDVIDIDGLTQVPVYGDVVSFDGGVSYYTVEDATPLVGGSSTITIREGLDADVSLGVTANFYERSWIAASGHTFEFVGTGTNVYDTPRSGAFPVPENEVVEDSNNLGQVYFTSTDHRGDFRIGSELRINRTTGTIEGQTFDRSLFAVMTPYILALED